MIGWTDSIEGEFDAALDAVLEALEELRAQHEPAMTTMAGITAGNLEGRSLLEEGLAPSADVDNARTAKPT